MKKILLSLFLCFAAVNAFAVTAEEVFKKSMKVNWFSFAAFQAYEIVYEYESSAMESVTLFKETVDGPKARIDAAVTFKKNSSVVNYSLIMTEEFSYVSVSAATSEGSLAFADYKVVNGTESVKTYEKSSSKEQDTKGLEISFDDTKKSKDEYAVTVSVKDGEKVRSEYERKRKNKEELTPEETGLYFLSMFDTEHFIDKKTYFSNKLIIKFSENFAYESVKDSDEYKDKSEEEKRKAAKELSKNSALFGTTYFSEYKPIEGTPYFYPSLAHTDIPLLDTEDKKAYFEIRTKEFKVLKSADIDPAVFVPANVKKGKGKLPKEYTVQGDAYEMMKDNIKKEIIKNIKESVKESAKEEGKNMLKKGVKGAFKGMGGF